MRRLGAVLAVLLVGITIGARIVETTLHNPRFFVVWVVALSLFVFLIPWVIVGKFGGPSKKAVAAARAAGRGAVAQVRSIRSTNVEINETRVYELELVVATHDRGTYLTKVRTPLDPIVSPDLSPGTLVSVVRIDDDKPRVALDFDTPVRGSISQRQVEDARPWGAAQEQLGLGTAVGNGMSSTSREPGSRTLVGAIVLLVVFLIGGGGTYAAGKWLTKPAVVPVEVDYLAHNQQLLDALDTIFATTGEYQSSWVLVYPEHITIDLPSPDYSGYYDSYIWRAGELTNSGSSSRQPEAHETFSARALQWHRLPDLLADARSQVSPRLATDAERTEYVVAQHSKEFLDDGTYEGPVFRVYLSNDYESAFITYSVTGELLRVHPQE